MSQEQTPTEAAAYLGLSRCRSLRSNPEFQWWLENTVTPALIGAHDDALDISKTAEERNQWAHVHAALSEVATFIDRHEAVNRGKVGLV